MRILFISATRIGDAVLSTGLLDHLIRTWPQAKIVVACGPVAEGVFARMPNRAWTILLTKRRLRLHWLELWREVGLERWDMVVDLRGSAFAWLVRARRRVVMRGGRQPGPRLGHLGALFGREGRQQVADTVLRTAAESVQRLRVEQTHAVFVEQAKQQGLRRQRRIDQLILADGLEERLGARPCVVGVAARRVAGHGLDQHPAGAPL